MPWLLPMTACRAAAHVVRGDGYADEHAGEK
jgi:hypothetical protein